MGLALGLFGSRILAAGASIVGWILGDWRRVVAVITVAALITTYVVADRRRAAADAVILQQRLAALTQAFETAAAKAKAEEEKRQAQIGDDLTAGFEKQQAARDVAEARRDAETERQILAFQAKLKAGGRSCSIGPDDLTFLSKQ